MIELPIELKPSVYLASVLAIGIAAQWLAWRFKLPAIVLLLFLGLGLGAVVGPPETYLGAPESGMSVLFPMVSLAVGVILFEGGLNLRLKEVRETGSVVVRLVSVGLAITAVLSSLAAHYLASFSWPIAILMGALLTVSGPTVILPLLRQVRPERQLGSIVKWEGIVNDPIGAVIAALVFEVVSHGSGGSFAHDALLGLAKTVVIGLGIGVLSSWLVVYLMRRYWVPDFLQNPVVLALVLLVFALSNWLQPESGLVTVTVLGVYLANQEKVAIKHVIEFKENLRVLLLSVLFIVLASRTQIGLAQLQSIGWGGLGFVLSIIFVIRPIAVWVSTLGTDLTRNERIFLAWIHPRGIVAAAVATLFALELRHSQPGLATEAPRMVLMTFLVIVATVSIYGLTLGRVARWLQLSRENPQGVLFAGATAVNRAIAQSLQAEGFSCLLVDTNPQNISAARMGGLRVCYASIGSEYVHQETDFGDIGYLLAMTPNDEVNTLAASEFVDQFGSANIYQLAPLEKSSERHERVPRHMRGRVLFGEGITHAKLRDMFNAGAQVKKNTLSDDYTLESFRAKYGDEAIVMFVVPEKGMLEVCSPDAAYEPKKGDKLIALVPGDKLVAEAEPNST